MYTRRTQSTPIHTRALCRGTGSSIPGHQWRSIVRRIVIIKCIRFSLGASHVGKVVGVMRAWVRSWSGFRVISVQSMHDTLTPRPCGVLVSVRGVSFLYPCYALECMRTYDLAMLHFPCSHCSLYGQPRFCRTVTRLSYARAHPAASVSLLQYSGHRSLQKVPQKTVFGSSSYVSCHLSFLACWTCRFGHRVQVRLQNFQWRAQLAHTHCLGLK